MDLEWASIEDFPNYVVSNYGDVMNEHTQRILSQSRTTQGARKVSLIGQDEQAHTRSVKVLVAREFVDGRTILFDTPIHLDADQDNCRADNLLWRPRWFALKYTRQFEDMRENYINRPILDVETREVYTNVFAAAVAHGLLMRDIFRTVHSLDAGVFPTWQTFEFVN